MATAVLKIERMDDEGSADQVTQVLSSITGVSDVVVSLLGRQASVAYDAKHTSPTVLASSLNQAGFPTEASEPAKASGSCCGGCCG